MKLFKVTYEKMCNPSQGFHREEHQDARGHCDGMEARNVGHNDTKSDLHG